MSFLIDPPLLVGTGAAIESSVDDPKLATRLELGVLVVFLLTSVSLYLNLRWTEWLWRMCGAQSGRDWMVNSGVLKLDHEHLSPKAHTVSAAIFATYPLWIHLGRKAAAARRACS
ncbi:MAG: hypothetical protein M1115_02425 [Actinobacteria bacterium]|nr:hypothetical protein [Actinomycetota bacterium]